MTELTGGCFCGKVRYRVEGPVLQANHCHCESCRRATSSPVTSFFTVRERDAEVSGASLASYQSSPGHTRGFCSHCGAPISYRSDNRPGELDLYLMTLDDPALVTVTGHDHWEERVPWLTVVDDLERREG